MQNHLTLEDALKLARSHGFTGDDPNGFVINVFNDAEHYYELWYMTRMQFICRSGGRGSDRYYVAESAVTPGVFRSDEGVRRFNLLPMAGGWKTGYRKGVKQCCT